MSGPELFEEALRLRRLAAALDSDIAMATLADAQLCATLALAAATALPGDLHQEWLAATKPTRAGAR